MGNHTVAIFKMKRYVVRFLCAVSSPIFMTVIPWLIKYIMISHGRTLFNAQQTLYNTMYLGFIISTQIGIHVIANVFHFSLFP